MPLDASDPPPDAGVPFHLPAFAVAGFEGRMHDDSKNVSTGEVKTESDLPATPKSHSSAVKSPDSGPVNSRRLSNRTIKRKKFDDEIIDFGSVAVHSAGHHTDSPSSAGHHAPSAAHSHLPPSRRKSQDHSSPARSVDRVAHNESQSSSAMDYRRSGSGKSVPSVSRPSSANGGKGDNVDAEPTLLTTTSSQANVSHHRLNSVPKDAKRHGSAQMFNNICVRLTNRRLKSLSKKGARLRHEGPWKDLSRWKSSDDLLLILSVMHTNDLSLVHMCAKFTCHFTLAEVHERWLALLYHPVISAIALQAIRLLGPESIDMIEAHVPYSRTEVDVIVKHFDSISNVACRTKPTDADFVTLLAANRTVFYKSRTVTSLRKMWNRLRSYSLMADQQVQPLPRDSHILQFADAERNAGSCSASSSYSADDRGFVSYSLPLPQLDVELASAKRSAISEIRHLECEIARWQCILDQIKGSTHSSTGGSAAASSSSSGSGEFDNQTLAVLRGRLVRYLMRNREITLGRSVDRKSHHSPGAACSSTSVSVDVDLSLEGPASKVSRLQGVIKLMPSAKFVLANVGRRPFFVDGVPVLSGSQCQLTNQCVLEIAGLRFIFIVNMDLMNSVRSESVVMHQSLLTYARNDQEETLVPETATLVV